MEEPGCRPLRPDAAPGRVVGRLGQPGVQRREIGGDASEFLDENAHATLGHAPLSGAISDEVIKETTIGLQIVGPRYADQFVLKLSKLFETLSGGMPRWPEPPVG